MTWRH